MPAQPHSGSPLSTDPLLRDVPEVGGKKFLPPALLESRLGHGGWGAVYRGLHLDLRRDVAVKVLKSDVQGDENLLRFQREARIAIELTHKNVVRVHDLRHEYGLSYIVMEYVEGRSAQALVDQRGPLPEREAAKIALYVTRGLATAHKHREVIVHRDIKPGNILISDQGEVKLADLGLAKAIERAGEATFLTMGVIGTPAYMPPEQ